jgi:hypothetical protein
MSIARDISRQSSTQTATLTAGQTNINVAGGFSGSSIDVYLNGARLIQTQDYTLNGTSGIVLTQSATEDDIVEFFIRHSSNSGVGGADTAQIVDGAVTIDKLSASATDNINVQKRVAKAWVTFDNTGAMFENINVSSVSDVGTGHYRVNFAAPMVDSNYCCVATADVKNAITNTVTAIYRKYLSDANHAEIVTSRYNNNLTDVDGDIGVVVFR